MIFLGFTHVLLWKYKHINNNPRTSKTAITASAKTRSRMSAESLLDLDLSTPRNGHNEAFVWMKYLRRCCLGTFAAYWCLNKPLSSQFGSHPLCHITGFAREARISDVKTHVNYLPSVLTVSVRKCLIMSRTEIIWEKQSWWCVIYCTDTVALSCWQMSLSNWPKKFFHHWWLSSHLN